MAKVFYVTCPNCEKRYYLDRLLQEVVDRDPNQRLRCPFCKRDFKLGTKLAKAQNA
jgi:uncharacterized Zn-finger protein